CWPSSRARKSWASSRARGLKAFADRFWSQLFASRDAVQSADRIRWIVDLSQSGQITAVGRQPEVAVAEEVRHTLSHINPSHDFLAFAHHLFADPKSRRFVNDHF